MPQLSPMSWVLVFMVFLVCFVLFGVILWWGCSGEYKIGVSKSLRSLKKFSSSK
uniref:ATP synthase F0 subunit 8 n=1 Tax=Sinohyriopsis schlegelii TaxID=2706150 RepID=E9NIL1_SINSH|nr:ATP synthase F0 subunit 8 [Sinohyriopsis schlegelii]ADU57240.1 ATP synthase F0 subunit 8 [Sinohyriopsis schlegelii]